MLKRAIFVLLMLAIPTSATIGMYFAFRALRVPTGKDVTAVEPQALLSQSPLVLSIVSWLTNQYNFLAFDNGRKALDQGIPAIIKAKGTEYRDNWAQVLAFVPIPGVSGNFLPNVRGKFVNTNDLGYRGTVNFRAQIAEAKQWKARGGKIAVYTGGSVAFGLYSDDDRTDIVGYLNQMSREQGSKIKFYNFAMGSYTSGEELNALVTYAAALEPDLLIVFDGFNDAIRLTHPPPYNVGIGVPYMYLSTRKSTPVLFQSEYLDRVYDANNVSAEQEAEFFEHYERNIRLMARIMAGGGGTTIVATQPLGFYKNACSHPPPGSYLNDIAGFYPKMIAAARAVSAEQKITYLDLTGVFEGSQDRCRGAYADSVHMASVGQRVIAERLYGASIKALSMKRPPS